MRRTVVTLADDLDGTEAEGVKTVAFGVDRRSYEIDLTPGHAQAFREMASGYAQFARKSPRGSGEVRTTAHRQQAAEKRAWARAHGFEVSERGRLPIEAERAWRDRAQ
jgi:hypothetical protein